MRRPRHEIEAEVPTRTAKAEGVPDSLPQIRRQMERICVLLGLAYEDLVEFHLKDGIVIAILFDRNSDGELYRTPGDRVAKKQVKIPVDTVNLIGDEEGI